MGGRNDILGVLYFYSCRATWRGSRPIHLTISLRPNPLLATFLAAARVSLICPACVSTGESRMVLGRADIKTKWTLYIYDGGQAVISIRRRFFTKNTNCSVSDGVDIIIIYWCTTQILIFWMSFWASECSLYLLIASCVILYIFIFIPVFIIDILYKCLVGNNVMVKTCMLNWLHGAVMWLTYVLSKLFTKSPWSPTIEMANALFKIVTLSQKCSFQNCYLSISSGIMNNKRLLLPDY